MFKCTDCNIEFKSYKGLQTHNSKTHKIQGVDTHVNFYYNGEWPLCKCGCMEKLNFQGGKFGDYIRGHAAKINGGFYSEKGLEKSAETRREQFASGERTQWNKGISKTEVQMKACIEAAQNPDRRKKISEKLTGKKKSPEHIAKIKADRQKYWSNQENRDAQRVRRSKYMSAHLIKNKTKLEKEFQTILNSLGVSYIFQYAVNGYNYDFYIPDKNILIEVDGDWWHCNPKLNIQPVYESQKHTIEHDLIKNKIALDNGYQLLRFWEQDITSNRFEVIANLMEICK
jgi:very-short-patch-repair endonuclease